MTNLKRTLNVEGALHDYFSALKGLLRLRRIYSEM